MTVPSEAEDLLVVYFDLYAPLEVVVDSLRTKPLFKILEEIIHAARLSYGTDARLQKFSDVESWCMRCNYSEDIITEEVYINLSFESYGPKMVNNRISERN